MRQKNEFVYISVLVVLMMFALASAVCLAQGLSACEEWKISISEYEKQADAIFDGEPEDMLGVLQDIIEAQEGEDAEALKELEVIIRGKVPALSKITPPDVLKGFHDRLIKYYSEIENTANVILGGDAQIISTHMRECYRALLEYYRELHSILTAISCGDGDVEALENKIIPKIEGILETRLSDAAILEVVYAKVWTAFLGTLMSGDLEKFGPLSTEKGYASLREWKKPSETEVEVLLSLLMTLGGQEARWKNISEGKVRASVGEGRKPSVLEFINVEGAWKFNGLIHWKRLR